MGILLGRAVLVFTPGVAVCSLATDADLGLLGAENDAAVQDGGVEGEPCGAGLRDCGSTECRDLSQDPLNCGRCGAMCSTGQDCDDGRCICVESLADCGDGASPDCRDLGRDPRSCGRCGMSCEPGSVCLDGVCGAPVTGCDGCDGDRRCCEIGDSIYCLADDRADCPDVDGGGD